MEIILYGLLTYYAYLVSYVAVIHSRHTVITILRLKHVIAQASTLPQPLSSSL